MKRIIFFLLFLIVMMLHQKSNASHLSGMHLTAQYTGTADTYLVRLYMYTDCQGINAPDSCFAYRKSVLANDSLRFTLFNISSSYVPVGHCTPSFTCGTPSIMKEVIYEATIFLPHQSDDWIVRAYDCCKTVATTNLSGLSNSISCTAFVDNLNYPGNSLPIVVNPTIPAFCLGFLAEYNFGAFDVDGDSLAYELIAPQDLYGTDYIYNPGYSVANIESITTPVNFDFVNGIVSFTPLNLGAYELAIKITEFRNGIKIGSVRKDVSFYVLNGTYSATGMDAVNFYDSSLMIYPNPTDNIVTVNSVGNEILNISVYDLQGRIVLEKITSSEDNSIDLSTVHAGIYFAEINIRNPDNVIRKLKPKRIIKQ